jgi:hypothetical protein
MPAPQPVRTTHTPPTHSPSHVYVVGPQVPVPVLFPVVHTPPIQRRKGQWEQWLSGLLFGSANPATVQQSASLRQALHVPPVPEELPAPELEEAELLLEAAPEEDEEPPLDEEDELLLEAAPDEDEAAPLEDDPAPLEDDPDIEQPSAT